MEIRIIREVLAQELGATHADDTYTLRDEQRLTVVLAHDGGTLAIAKVRSVRFVGELVVLSTEEGRTFVEPAGVFALRAEEQDRPEGRPGFHR